MGRLLALIAKIHRRFLWQTLIIYLVVSYLTYRVSSEVAARRQLPDWFVNFAIALLIIGLPVVLITSYVQGVLPPLGHHKRAGSKPDQGSPHETTSGGKNRIRRIFTWRNAMIGGVAAFILWALVGVGWLYLASEIVDDVRRPAVQDSIAASQR